MKRIHSLLILLLCTAWLVSLYGQTTVGITGIVKSPAGSVQNATITFVSMGDEFLSNCTSGPDGMFKSLYKFQVGKTIKIRVTANSREYDDLEKVYAVEKNGNAGEFMFKRKMLIISGIAKDSVSEVPLPGVSVSYYDESSAPIQALSTNSEGRFDIETNFRYGQKITVRLFKKDYYAVEQTHTFSLDGINKLADIRLPKIGDRGLRAFITVIDKKNGKPLTGVNIHYLDRKRSTYLDTLTGSNGKVELKLYQGTGATLEMEISKPNFQTRVISQRLVEELSGNAFTYELEKDRHSTLGPLLLIGGGTAALASTALYLSSNSKYKSYKDFANPERESDYDAAQTRLNIAIATGVVAVGCIVGYVIYKTNLRKKERIAEERNQKKISVKRFSLNSPSYATAGKPIIGVAYHF